MFKDEQSVNFLKDPAVQDKFAHAKKLSEVNVNDYDAIFYVGGHGPVIDLASDPVNSKLISDVGICPSSFSNRALRCYPSSGMQENTFLQSATGLRKSIPCSFVTWRVDAFITVPLLELWTIKGSPSSLERDSLGSRTQKKSRLAR